MCKKIVIPALIISWLTAGTTQPYNLTETKDIVYGKGWVTNPSEGLKDLLMDAYIPDNPATDKAAIIYMHGGGWKSGDKSSRVSDFRDLAARGFCLFSINYRMVGDGLVCPPIATGTAPELPAVRAAVVDCRAAVRYVRAHAAEYGISQDRIVTLGGSAGAYTSVVACIAEEDSFLNDGPGDPAIPYNNSDERSKPDLCTEMFGFTISWLPNFRDDIDSTDPPVLIMHGDADALIPFQNAYSFRTYFRNEGIPWELHIVEGGVHGEWFDSTNVWMENFINEHLYSNGITWFNPGLPAGPGYTGGVRWFDLLGRQTWGEAQGRTGVYFRAADRVLVPGKALLIK